MADTKPAKVVATIVLSMVVVTLAMAFLFGGGWERFKYDAGWTPEAQAQARRSASLDQILHPRFDPSRVERVKKEFLRKVKVALEKNPEVHEAGENTYLELNMEWPSASIDHEVFEKIRVDYRCAFFVADGINTVTIHVFKDGIEKLKADAEVVELQ